MTYDMLKVADLLIFLLKLIKYARDLWGLNLCEQAKGASSTKY